MKTKMSATSSGEVAPSQSSAVSTSTTQSSVWSLCDISTDSHVDLRDITPSISPVFTDDQVHALTRNPNEVDVLDQHFLPHDTFKRIDEVLKGQTNLLYNIANTGPAAHFSDNDTVLGNALKHNHEDLLHGDLHFPETMFSGFDSMSDVTDRIMSKDDVSLHPVVGRDISQIAQSDSLNWQKDGACSLSVDAKDSNEEKSEENADSDMPTGLRRSPRKRVQMKKDSEGSKTGVSTPKPVSRGKDISKLKYAPVKKEDAQKEVRRSGRMQKKVDKEDSSEDKEANEAKANTKKKKTKGAEEEPKESSEPQDVAGKNVRRSPRNQSKNSEDGKQKLSKKKQEKSSEVSNDNKKEINAVSSEKDSESETSCDREKKSSKSENKEDAEKNATETDRARKEQDEKHERRKSGRITTRNTGKKDTVKEDEGAITGDKTRRKEGDNAVTEKAEKLTLKTDKSDEEEPVKNRKDLGSNKNLKSSSKNERSSSKVKTGEAQNKQEGKQKDTASIETGKKDQLETKETDKESKEKDNQASSRRKGKMDKELSQANVDETAHMVVQVTSLKKEDIKEEEVKSAESKVEKQTIKPDEKETEPTALIKNDDNSGRDEKNVNPATEERAGEKSSRKEEVTTAVKREDGKEDSDMESSENEEEVTEDSDYDPEYDPDRLWCVCRKPHGNRFMICCDHCEDWFHGGCVGITMSQGRQMEKKGQEYVCPKCKAKLQEESSKEAHPTTDKTLPSTPEKAKQDKPSKKDHSPKLKMPDDKDKPRRRRHSSHRKSGDNTLQDERKSKESDKISAKDQVKEERKRKSHESTGFKIPKKNLKRSYMYPEGMGNVRTTPTPVSYMMHPVQRKCIATGCPLFTDHDSLYCSQECIARHAEESVKILTDERMKRMGAKITGASSKSVTSPTSSLLGPVPWDPSPTPAFSQTEPLSKEGVAVIERSTGRVIAGVAAPTQEELVFWLQDHPMFEVLRPSVPFSKDEKKKEKKEDSEKTVRDNIRKSLKEILITRCKEQQDLVVSEEDFDRRAHNVEEEMYYFFGDTGSRYKNKYRSLMFNLKDPRNKVLFRHVLTGEISVDRLVRMTPEQLASPELATWREQEVKHTLEMIRLNQEEINATKAHIKKTHKGEVEIDGDDDLSSLENSIKMKAELNVEKGLPDSNTSSSTLLLDTTDEHRIHLFDLNCRICTGKMAPPGEPPRSNVPAPLVSTTSIIQAVAESSIPSPPPMDVTSANSPDSASVSQPSLSPSALNKMPKKVPAVWKGFVMMQSVAKFGTSAYRVSGSCEDLLQLLPDTLHVQGRIAHEQVWDYLVQLKSSTSREVSVIRYEASSDEEKMSYVSLYSYFYSRKRCGVVSNCYTGVKDMYLVPLASHQRVPPELLPFDGPGLDEPRPHMLLGVIVRAKALFKRPRALSQRSLSPPTKRRASSGSQETSSSEDTVEKSPANKRHAPRALHDSPPADIDDIVFQYHTSQAVKSTKLGSVESPAKASTPSDASTPSLTSSSGAVVSPGVTTTEQPPPLSLEAQKQHLLDLQERARQYILAQTQRKDTDSGAKESEGGHQGIPETTGVSKGEQQGVGMDDDAPYDPEEGLELDLDIPPSKSAPVVPEPSISKPAVVATHQEPAQPSGIQMLVSTLKKLQGAAMKGLTPQLSALSSVLTSQGTSSTVGIQEDHPSRPAASSTHPLQPTALASQSVRISVPGGYECQSTSSAGDILQPITSPGRDLPSAAVASSNSGPSAVVSSSLGLQSTRESSVSSSQAWQPTVSLSTPSTAVGPHTTIIGRVPPSTVSTGLRFHSAGSIGRDPQSTVSTTHGSQSTPSTGFGPQGTASMSRGPLSTVLTGFRPQSAGSNGRDPQFIASSGLVPTTVSTDSGTPSGIMTDRGMQSTTSIGLGPQSTVSSDHRPHSAATTGPSLQSAVSSSQRQQSVAPSGLRSAASTSHRQQSTAPSGHALQRDADDSRSNRWNPSEPPHVVRQVENVAQHISEFDNLRPEERARLAARESRLESREGRGFRGHHRDEHSGQGRSGDRHRPDWSEQRYHHDSRPLESDNGWRGQHRPGRQWFDDERRRDGHERPVDERSRPGERRQERRFQEHWSRDRWRR